MVVLRLAGVLAERGRYAAAADLAREVHRGLTAGKPDEVAAASALARVALLRLAAGDREAAAPVLQELADKYGRSDQPAVLASVVRAWAFAPADLPGWDRADAVRRLAAATEAGKGVDRPLRVLALAHLRTGTPAAAAAAVRSSGGPKAPIDHLILGLAAARLGDGDTAAARLREADDLTAKAAPSPANPFAHADGDWLDRVEAKWLREELARALDPRLAPEPREARR